jgi:uncharacterized membrane-anchored protein
VNATDATSSLFRRELFGIVRHEAGKGHDPVFDRNTDIGVGDAGFPFQFGHHVTLQLVISFHHQSP